MSSQLEIDVAGLHANLRHASYEMVNGWLAAHRVLAAALPVAPGMLLVYLTVGVATVQRVVRGGELSDDLRAGAPLPRAMRGGISRRGIADATGLPRETVRRHVAALLADNRLCEERRGIVSVPPAFLHEVDAAPVLAEMAAGTARLAETLLRLGVLRAR